ncbi:ribosome maturation factor RimP [Chitinispirillales bacterium ANBcel5]|uniref:ribosome maturation factor RimP n=1 Tax=Cellulosispirillum alkaliphilum TaxID=3039283 RepID=UPI002A51B29C|nr:ribosome maturation factor RimP [Chitinispirillales bacterium ANBcel5]
METVERITPLVTSKLEELGLELYELRFFHAGKRSILRVTIDSPEGVKIRDCEQVSRELSELLDANNFSANRPYNLEVSSPGIDRPLKTERDFNRIKGRDVVVHVSQPIEGKKSIRGKVIGCEGNKLVLENEHNTMVEIPLCDILSGREEIRFK